MNEETSDYTLQNYYKKKLRLSRYAYAHKKLSSQAWCAVRTIKAPMHKPAVFILANKVEAKIWGVQVCKSPWSCPTCSARRMAKEASRIASAIELLNKKGKAAFLITFNNPHYHDWTAKQTYEILKETWKHFVHQAKTTKGNGKYDVFAQFCNEFNCEHRIRVGEFTWGHYGWNPHYHCLFFVDKSKLQAVLNWQEKFSKRWHELARKAAIKILTRDNYCQDVQTFVNNYFDSSKSQYNNGIPDAYISRNSDGSVMEAKSSQYICGWGADKELTGNFRKMASHKGHYTPHQLLQKAYDLDNETLDNPEADKYFSLYVEYALATFRTYRVRMSPTLKSLIEEYQKTQDYIETCKKKLAEAQATRGKWRIVCWFTPEQWFSICQLSLEPHILELAKQINGKQLIETLLLKHQIDIRQNGEHIDQAFFAEMFCA